MTWDELLYDSFRPEGEMNRINGLTNYKCPVCGSFVGIHSSGKLIDEGWQAKRDVCKNGHRVNWEGLEE